MKNLTASQLGSLGGKSGKGAAKARKTASLSVKLRWDVGWRLGLPAAPSYTIFAIHYLEWFRKHYAGLAEPSHDKLRNLYATL